MIISTVVLPAGDLVFNLDTDSEYWKALDLSDIERSEIISAEVARVANANRASAYVVESDPLFLEALRKDAAGDAEGAETARAAALVAVEAIKERYPLPTE